MDTENNWMVYDQERPQMRWLIETRRMTRRGFGGGGLEEGNCGYQDPKGRDAWEMLDEVGEWGRKQSETG